MSPELPPRPNSLEIYSAPDEEAPEAPKSPTYRKNPPAPPNHVSVQIVHSYEFAIKCHRRKKGGG